MGGSRWVPTTQRSYALFEVISALQKEIRRASEKEALYWALELCPQYESALWRRLLVIAHEDIGLGNPQVFTALPQMRDSYFEFREKGNGACWLVLTNAILLLCRSPKSRIGDEFLCVVMDAMERGEMRLDIPDYALDGHTARGKRMGRGSAFFQEHCLLVPQSSDVSNPYTQEAIDRWGKGAKVISVPPLTKTAKGKQEQAEAQQEALAAEPI